MDTARAMITVLTIAAFGLPAYAAWRTYRGAVAAVTEADQRARKYERIYLEFLEESRKPEWQGRGDEVSALFRPRYEAIGYDAPTYSNMVYAPVHATARALRASLNGAASNAWLAVLGLVFGAVAALWSLYLPPL